MENSKEQKEKKQKEQESQIYRCIHATNSFSQSTETGSTYLHLMKACRRLISGPVLKTKRNKINISCDIIIFICIKGIGHWAIQLDLLVCIRHDNIT